MPVKDVADLGRPQPAGLVLGGNDALLGGLQLCVNASDLLLQTSGNLDVAFAALLGEGCKLELRRIVRLFQRSAFGRPQLLPLSPLRRTQGSRRCARISAALPVVTLKSIVPA